MTHQASSWPLQWPDHIPRTRSGDREKGQFKTSYNDALQNVISSLRLFGKDSGKVISAPVLSSNTDMLGQNPTGDPGVAVWFSWDGLSVCIPVDRYQTARANLQAIHHVIEARRVELRHGTLHLVRASLKGFLALPSPPSAHWSSVLGISRETTKADVEAAFKRLASVHHPDRGGSDDKMAEINRARAQALQEAR